MSIDKTLRDCVRDIRVHIGNNTVNESLLWKSYPIHRGRKIFEREFEQILAQVRHATGLMIESPCLFGTTKGGIKETVKTCLYDVVKLAPRTLAADGQSRLKALEFRSSGITISILDSTPMPMYLLQDFSRDPVAFANLKTLKLVGVDWDAGPEHTPTSATRTVLDDLKDLQAFAPNTTTLVYYNVRPSDYPSKADYSVQELHAHVILQQPLTKLALGDFNIGEVQFSHILLSFKHTLKSLTFRSITIVSGSWQKIFALLRNKLHLQDVDLFMLCGGDDQDGYEKAVKFHAITDQRPVAVDAETVLSRDVNWYRAMSEVRLLPDSREYKVRVKALKDMTADGWVWICHDQSSYKFAEDLELHASEGDDINMWLALVENHSVLQ